MSCEDNNGDSSNNEMSIKEVTTTNVNDAGSTRISAHTGFDTSLYWSPVVQAQAAVLSDALAANSFRFDGSDNMPPAVGAGTFWVEMTELATNGPSYIDTALDNIENSWP